MCSWSRQFWGPFDPCLVWTCCRKTGNNDQTVRKIYDKMLLLVSLVCLILWKTCHRKTVNFTTINACSHLLLLSYICALLVYRKVKKGARSHNTTFSHKSSISSHIVVQWRQHHSAKWSHQQFSLWSLLSTGCCDDNVTCLCIWCCFILFCSLINWQRVMSDVCQLPLCKCLC
jgi:hypothetical protein